ncbi:MAG: hypothetical protein AAF547_25420, partial [Actinomycetota bacterium]
MASRVERSFTSISWIPSEAMTGLMRLPMDVGLGHYDEPPPDHIDDIEAFVSDGRCRFANRLEVWAVLDDGLVVDAGSSGGGLVAATEVDLRALSIRVAAIPYPEIRVTEHEAGAVRFVQTAGGRTGAPFPRRVGGGNRFRMTSPTAWTTLAVTVRPDGSTEAEVRGASPFPRHWFYDHDGNLVRKSATIEFDRWTSGEHEVDTPWGDADNAIVATEAESALERTLSRIVMAEQGRRPSIRTFQPGEVLMTQGEPARSM